jgi:ferritin
MQGMKTEIRDALNQHLILELRAWYEYTGMALWFERNDLPGFAAFMQRQADEELAHARRFIDHLTERDQVAVLPELGAARLEYESAGQAFEAVLAAEQKVTASIHDVFKLAERHDDQPARIMLEWFINEQVEEENMARSLIGRLRLAGETGPGLLLLDQELASGTVPGMAPEGGE